MVRAILCGLMLGCLVPTAWAGPREELLRLVPEDTGFCLMVNDLDRRIDEFMESEFLARVRTSPLGRVWKEAPEMRNLEDLNSYVKKHLGMDLGELRKDVFGDSVLFAYRPAAARQEEMGLMLLHARKPERLAALVERLNELQKRDGEVKEIVKKKHRDQEYIVRREQAGNRYCLIAGALLAVATDETALKGVIDRRASGTREDTALMRKLSDHGLENKFATLWINPRAFEAEIARRHESVKGPEAFVVQGFIRYWRSLDAILISLNVDKRDVDLGLHVLANPERVPPAARPMFSGEFKAAETWQFFPGKPIFAVTGRFESAPLLDLAREFVPEASREEVRKQLQRDLGGVLDRDLMRDVVPHVGPEWGLCVAAPPAKQKDWFPHILFAVRVHPGDGERPLDQAVLEVLHSVAVLYVLGNNQRGDNAIELKKTTRDKIEIRYLMGKHFPEGCHPAYCVKDGYLLLASSPLAVSRFSKEGAGKVEADRQDGQLLLHASFVELGSYVRERREAITDYLVADGKEPKDEVARRLAAVGMLGQFVEKVELRQFSSRGKFGVTFQIRAACSLGR